MQRSPRIWAHLRIYYERVQHPCPRLVLIEGSVVFGGHCAQLKVNYQLILNGFNAV